MVKKVLIFLENADHESLMKYKRAHNYTWHDLLISHIGATSGDKRFKEPSTKE